MDAQEQKRDFDILLVDDDDDYRMIVSRWLKKEYDILDVASGTEAVELLKTKTPGLVLLDYSMPEPDGPKTLKLIREDSKNAHIPVAFLTGMEETREEDGAVTCLSKSMGKAAILEEVHRLLAI